MSDLSHDEDALMIRNLTDDREKLIEERDSAKAELARLRGQIESTAGILRSSTLKPAGYKQLAKALDETLRGSPPSQREGSGAEEQQPPSPAPELEAEVARLRQAIERHRERLFDNLGEESDGEWDRDLWAALQQDREDTDD